MKGKEWVLYSALFGSISSLAPPVEERRVGSADSEVVGADQNPSQVPPLKEGTLVEAFVDHFFETPPKKQAIKNDLNPPPRFCLRGIS